MIYRMERKIAPLVLLTSLLIHHACDSHSGSESPVSSEEFHELTAPYPKGGWRLARHRLQEVALTFSHVLIRHDQTVSETANFRAPNWDPDEVSEHSMSEARYLAAKIAKQLREQPARFPELVAKYSEDVVTKAHGGSFGTWSANLIPPQLLDALQAMSVGQVSRVVQSDFGFHVLMLRANPEQQWVSARRIVIGYAKTAPTLLREGRSIQRTRGEALALAREVARRAQEQPSDFISLIERHSDHADAARGGDIGLWSNLDAHVMNRELEIISALRIGQTSEPIDTPDGFCVFLREPATPREELAWEQLDVGIALRADRAADGAVSLRSYADTLLAQILQEPTTFDALRARGCCPGKNQAPVGRGVPQVEVALRNVRIGDFAAMPVEFDPNSISIVRRVDTTPRSSGRTISDTLPTRTEPDIPFLVQHAVDSTSLAMFIETMHQSINPRQSLDLAPESAQILDDIVAELNSRLRASEPHQRMALIDAARRKIRDQLGPEVEEPYYQQLTNEIIRQLL